MDRAILFWLTNPAGKFQKEKIIHEIESTPK